MVKPIVLVLILGFCSQLFFAQELDFSNSIDANELYVIDNSSVEYALIHTRRSLQSDLRFILFKSYRITHTSETGVELKDLLDFQKEYSDSKIEKDIEKLNALKDSNIYNTFYTNSGDLNVASLTSIQIDTSLVRIDILKDVYFQPEYNSNKKPRNRFLNKGKIITKDGLRERTGKKSRSNKVLHPITFEDKSFEIQVDTSVTKNVSGYDCFLIRLVSKTNSNLWVELYVTDKIDIPYNPLFNLELCYDRGLFILEKIIYSSKSIEITKPKYIQLN